MLAKIMLDDVCRSSSGGWRGMRAAHICSARRRCARAGNLSCELGVLLCKLLFFFLQQASIIFAVSCITAAEYCMQRFPFFSKSTTEQEKVCVRANVLPLFYAAAADYWTLPQGYDCNVQFKTAASARWRRACAAAARLHSLRPTGAGRQSQFGHEDC